MTPTCPPGPWWPTLLAHLANLNVAAAHAAIGAYTAGIDDERARAHNADPARADAIAARINPHAGDKTRRDLAAAYRIGFEDGAATWHPHCLNQATGGTT